MRHAAAKPGGRAVLLFAVYLLVCVGPLALSFTDLRPGRGFVVDFSVALGFVALSVLGLQFVISARLTKLISPFSLDAVLRYHRQITLLALVAAFGHPLLLFAVDSDYRALMDLLDAPVRAQLAWVAVIALAVLVITSLWRKALRLSYPAWHALHAVLGVTVVLTALAHALLVDYYMSELWERAAWGVYGLAFCWLAVWVRLVRPLRMGLSPWRISALWPEPGGALTVSLEPAIRPKDPFTFKAGQFAWIQSHGNAWGLDYHPFTMSSSPERPGQVDFTIAPVGPWTDGMRRVRVGDRMYLDGPHGSFTLDRHPGLGYVFLGTGVGVTPFLSMLETMIDRGETRPCWLFLGNRYENQITGIRKLIRAVVRMPNLHLVNVISRPTADWVGPTGHIDAALLAQHLPAHYRHLEFYICARPEIVRSLRHMLRQDLHVGAERIHCEELAFV